MKSYHGVRVTVVGLGREGCAVARVLAGEGAHVTVSDTRTADLLVTEQAALTGLPIRYSLGGNRPDEALAGCDLLVLSPGVDKRVPLVREALRRGITISSETALFFERCAAPIVGITGSAGKTTTTTLIGAMLRRGERPIFVGGNIGQPLLERVGEITPEARVVLELSSFQLEWLRASPHLAVVTNVTPNHLDRHETMEAYAAAKANIVRYQAAGDVAVVNADDAGAVAVARQAPGRVLYWSLICPVEEGAFLEGDRLTLAHAGQRTVLSHTDDLRVPGRHNIANTLAAALVAALCGIDATAIRDTIRAFRGVPHRLQLVGTVGGVTFYDDSIATAPERTLAALAAIAQPVVLILGGRDKHLPWDDLAHAAVARCRGVVLIGEAAGLIRHHLEQALATTPPGAPALLRRVAIATEESMAGAVAHAARLARPGDAVLLSPACTSYDMYRNFEERGDLFAQAVGGLKNRG